MAKKEASEKLLPQNIEAEAGVLGSLLIDPGAIVQVADFLRADDFYREAHREIYHAALDLREAGEPADLITLTDELERRGKLEEVGGISYVSSLANQVPTSANAEYYGRIVQRTAVLRRLISTAGQIAAIAYSEPDASVALDESEKLIAGVRITAERSTMVKKLSSTNMADVEAEDFHWLWHGRVALGKLAEFLGDGGIGKSLATLDLTARVVEGDTMPDGSPGLDSPAAVAIIAAEDGLADTVKPRLQAAGVNPEAMRRIEVINGAPETLSNGTVIEHMVSLLADLPALEAKLTEIGARLLIIDPITAYLGDGVDAHRDNEVRRVLTPLAKMAERLDIAVVYIRHINRSQGVSAQHRGMGSVAFTNTTRLCMLFAPNPDAEGEVLMSRYKNNIGAPVPTLAYRIVQVGEAENMPRIVWQDGERRMSAGDALAAQTGASADPETRSATSVAIEWLIIYLAEGPQLVNQIVADAIEAQIIEKGHLKPLRTASERVCLKPPRKNGMSGGWEWELDPAKAPTPGERASSASNYGPGPDFKPTPAKMPTLENNGHLRTETPPKMPTLENNGHLRADAVEFSADDALEGELPSKMPTPQDIGTFKRAEHVCPVTGGSHIYGLQRTHDGRPVCVECQQPAAAIGA